MELHADVVTWTLSWILLIVLLVVAYLKLGTLYGDH